MLKIKKSKFTSRELQNGFKFVKVNDKLLKIKKAIRTKEKYELICGENDVVVNAFNVDYIYEIEDRDIKIISEETLEVNIDKIEIIESLDDFTKWYRKTKQIS